MSHAPPYGRRKLMTVDQAWVQGNLLTPHGFSGTVAASLGSTAIAGPGASRCVTAMRLGLLSLAVTSAVLVSAFPEASALLAQDVGSLKVKGGLKTVRPGTGTHADTTEAGLGDWVRVEVDGLAAATQAGSVKPSKLVLYLDGRPLPGVHGTLYGPSDDWLEFRLQRTDSSKAAWAALLGRPTHDHHLVTVSVGPDGGPELAGVGDSLPHLNLIIYHSTTLWVCLVLSAILLYASWLLATRSNILRDSSGQTPSSPDEPNPYSLAKFQMAVWFLLIALSFGFIYAITWDYNTITEQALILMGIATLTALGGKVIDANKTAAADHTRSDAAAVAAKIGSVQAKLVANPPGLPEDVQALTALRAEQARLTSEAERRGSASKSRSRSFLLDILSDENGISLHRFQMFVWTLILGLLFVIGVYNDLAMPAFNQTLLTLMGISSGTYLSFKIPERHA